MHPNAHALVSVEEGPPVALHPGDLIGRLRSAALRVDDPRVSEAHALVSLRAGELQLLALRGVLAVERQRVTEVVLVEGLRIRVAKDLHLRVHEVHVPVEALAVAVDDAEPQMLIGAAASVVVDPEPGLLPRFEPDAPAHLWSDGFGWRMRWGDRVEALEADQVLEIDGHVLRVVTVPLLRGGQEATAIGGQLQPPLRLVANYDTAHLHRKGREPVLFSGIQARILSELVAFGGPTTWEVVAEEIWRDDPVRHHLRRRWDVNLGRLRARLEQHGIRPDLVRSDGTGRVELVLLPGDEIEDHT